MFWHESINKMQIMIFLFYSKHQFIVPIAIFKIMHEARLRIWPPCISTIERFLRRGMLLLAWRLKSYVALMPLRRVSWWCCQEFLYMQTVFSLLMLSCVARSNGEPKTRPTVDHDRAEECREGDWLLQRTRWRGSLGGPRQLLHRKTLWVDSLEYTFEYIHWKFI